MERAQAGLWQPSGAAADGGRGRLHSAGGVRGPRDRPREASVRAGGQRCGVRAHSARGPPDAASVRRLVSGAQSWPKVGQWLA